MLILEIVLIVIGLAAVILSYKLTDSDGKSVSETEKNAMGYQDGVSFDDVNIEEIEEKIQQIQEESMLKTSDELSRISNEKLMGMDEYSSEVLERIEKNHEEVVFLYNMLNEKETEIKQLMKHVDSVKVQLQEAVAEEYQKISASLKDMEDKKRELEGNAAFDFSEELDFEEEETKSEKEELSVMYDKEVEAIEREEQKEQRYFPKKSENTSKQKKNHNNEIIQLYKNGHSILEISRMLSLGQGEVKFVIDLYETK